MSTFNLSINDQTVEAHSGETIIQAAHRAGIDIPTLCYHPLLSPEEACRICVVEDVRGNWSTLVAACVYPASPGMVIFTQSEKVLDARRTILELLLSDHPIDCMTCNAAGSCELQDMAYSLGVTRSSFSGETHDYPVDPDPGPWVHWDMNKCILCRRCVKACTEVQGAYVLAKADRGFQSHISTAYGDTLEQAGCESCGQCITFCPVDAISDKPARGKWRNWEMTVVTTTCPHCPCGCAMDLNVVGDQLVKVTANFDSPANRGALCFKGRFNQDKLLGDDRLTAPLVREGDNLVETDWDTALAAAAEALGGQVAVVAGGELTNEEGYLLARLAKDGLSGAATDFAGRLPRVEGVGPSPVENIDAGGAVLAVGGNSLDAAPMLALAARRAGRSGKPVVVAGAEKDPLNRAATQKLNTSPEKAADVIGGILRALVDEGLAEGLSAEGLGALGAYASASAVSAEDLTGAAKTLFEARPVSIILSLQRVDAKAATDALEAAARLVDVLGGGVWAAGSAANDVGLSGVGLGPDGDGPDLEAIAQGASSGQYTGVLAMGAEAAQLARAKLVVLDTKLTNLAKSASVVLPIVSYAETGGTVTNLEGRVGRISDALSPIGDSRPGWRVLIDLTAALGVKIDADSPADVFGLIAGEAPGYGGLTYGDLTPGGALLGSKE